MSNATNRVLRWVWLHFWTIAYLGVAALVFLDPGALPREHTRFVVSGLCLVIAYDNWQIARLREKR